MAERRMMSKKIIHSDAFLDMPATSQNLYFHLLLEADDEGFVNSPKRIQRTVGASDGDAQMLIAKKFIISFNSGIVVIKHWRIHNYIQNDRFKATTYTDEKNLLSLDKNDGYKMDTNCTPSIGKDSIGKDSIVEVSLEENSKERVQKFKAPTLEDIKEYIKEKSLIVDANKFFDYFEAGGWSDANGKKVKNWKQKLLTWNAHTRIDAKAKAVSDRNNINAKFVGTKDGEVEF